MKDDVIDNLKLKEEEIEARLSKARAEAAAIKDSAARRARDIKDDQMNRMHKDVSEEQQRETEELVRLVSDMDAQAAKAVAALRDKSAGRRGEAAAEVLNVILGKK